MLRAILAVWILPAVASAAQTVDGHVVNSATGADIPDVTVRLLHAGEVAYSATTDAQGRFRFDAVKDGAYTATCRARGFQSVPDSLGAAAQPSFAVATAAKPVHLETKLHSLPRISGRVLDGAGNSVPNASLWVLQPAWGCGAPSCFSVLKQSQTGDKGDYSISDIDAPGPWLLSATAPPSWNPPGSREGERFGWAQAFYPSATDPQLGTKLLVLPGDELWNLDIKLTALPVHRILGRILNVRGDPLPKASVTLGNGLGPSLHQETTIDGTFAFGSVPDGEWRLSARADRDGVKLWAGQPLQIKRRDLEDVEMRLTQPFSIHGRIEMKVSEGALTPKLPELPDIVMDHAGAKLEDTPPTAIGEADGKGGFTFQPVYPGPHRIAILSMHPGPYYLDSIRLGDQDALVPGVPILSDAQPLTLTYKLDGGTVRGIIEGCASARILLLPQDPALRRGEFLRETNCGQNGHFEFTAVRPGEYYGLAIMSGSSPRWYADLRDDDLIGRRASKVTVRANEFITAEIRPTKW